MSWTKRQFIEAALEEIGIASYTFDITPEQLQSHLGRLDSMIATWNAKGIYLSYPIPSNPTKSDLDTDTTVPDSGNEAIILNLACRLAPSYGKQASPDTKQNALTAYNAMIARNSTIPQVQNNGTVPAGAGYRGYNRTYLAPPVVVINNAGVTASPTNFF